MAVFDPGAGLRPFRERLNSYGVRLESDGVVGKSGGAGGVAVGTKPRSGRVLLSADGVKAEPDGAGLWPNDI